jgi:uncharacterized protein YuzB (UPF0349 family)
MIKIPNLLLLLLLFNITAYANSEICHSDICLTQRFIESPIKFIPINVGDIFFVIPIDHPSLPAAPGLNGEKTLLGVDSDGDGIRDDVYRYIVKEYWDKPHVEFIFLNAAKSIQNIAKNKSNPDYVISEYDKLITIRRCADSLFQDSNIKYSNFKSTVYNTPLRIITLMTTQGHLAGKSYTGMDPSEYHTICKNILNY